MGRFAFAIVMAFALALPLGAANAQNDRRLVINLTSADVWTGQMAMSFARRVQEDGGNVVLFLNVHAVAFANQNVPQHVQALTGKTPHERIQEIIDAGGEVYLCPSCTEQAGLKIEDRIDGVKVGGPEFREILMAPDTKIISY
ncbi:DsrE family protein [Dichotomicrobium thermohalophilum]|nr:DsrE family protein [Dichotomicrobium thermohalophilum]